MELIILVSGGNRGIGKEICRQLAYMGHTVYLGSRDIRAGESVADSLKGNVIPVRLDVTNEEDIRAAYSKIEADQGRLDVLINNAGIYIGSKGLRNPDLKAIRDTFEANFFGPIHMNSIFLPLLKNSNQGRIINISSGMGALKDLTGGYAGYRLSKTGLNAQTILLANELSGDGIRVNSMCPGWVRTDMGGAGASRSVEKGAETAVWLATEKDIPTGKFFRDKKVIPW